MGVEDLRGQFRKHKLLGKAGFALSLRPTARRTSCSVKTFLLEANEDANDLEDGDPASTAAAFGAARLSEAESAGVGCAPTWAT
eukprot:1620975-Pleurochrysis_carterae.AAC.1